MTPDDVLADGWRDAPWWWERAPPVNVADPPPLPAAADVAIVGAGLTGLRAALTLLRAGRSVVILDAADPGAGASRRNAGYLGRVLKQPYTALLTARGQDHAVTLYRELDEAFRAVVATIEDEAIDCHWQRCGRFVGATSPAHYEAMARELAAMQRDLGFPFDMVPRAEQHAEMATDYYFGGAVIPDLGSIHPGLYHRGLLDRVIAAGGIVRGRIDVLTIEPGHGAARPHRLATAAGSLVARDVVVATNGYTPRQFGWHARRVIPFAGYMAATEALSPGLVAKVLPNGRTVIDSNTNIDYFRPAPDSPRILFGGATGSRLATPRAIAGRLHAILRHALPDLAGVRLSHVWSGQCAGTFDLMPHIGRHDGIWYAMGYNFAGLPMGTWFGLKLAQSILGLREGRTLFAEAPFRTAPLYTGNPWFVPIAMRWFDWQDRRFAARNVRATQPAR